MFAGVFALVFGEGGEEAVLGLDEGDGLAFGIEMAEVAGEIALNEVGEGSGEFDSSGAASDDDDGGEFTAVGFFAAFGEFEVLEDVLTDAEGVLCAFELVDMLLPVVISEEAGFYAGGDDEVVVGDFLS